MSERKYKQRGYQEDSRGQERRRGPAPPRERREGPRGRGLGAPTATVFRCAVCGAIQEAPAAEAFAAVCGKCGTDLHSCTHCAHFDTSQPAECRKPVKVRIRSKSKRNECELFAPKVVQEFDRGGASGGESAGDAKAAFDALFKL